MLILFVTESPAESDNKDNAKKGTFLLLEFNSETIIDLQNTQVNFDIADNVIKYKLVDVSLSAELYKFILNIFY